MDDISANSDVVPTTGHMPAILEVFCGLHGASLRQFCCRILRLQGRAGQGIWAGVMRWEE